MTRLALLGSTGSIGRQALEVIEMHRDRFEVGALAAGHLDQAFRAQLERWPQAAAWTADRITDPRLAARWAEGGLEQLAADAKIDIVLVATTGIAALPAVLAALAAGRRVALANKETLVTGGHLVDRALGALGGDRLDWLRPIDSEHSAIWQCLLGERLDEVERLILTASGGPFRGRALTELGDVTPAEALAHPTWQMGPKVTIDSATLVNKALEAIEAKWLYRLPYSRIEAVIHPRSMVHSLVEFTDGSYKAQIGLPDMRMPIQFALTYPRRLASPARSLPPAEWGSLEFGPLDPDAVPAYRVVREAADAGGNRGTVLNAADEVAVEAFLAGRLPFIGIGPLIEDAVERWGRAGEPELAEIHAIDREVRQALRGDLGLGAA
ncbi:MAG: 1-deoxy-D-xylulose-5-phosphate reductoisomerase [Chloroflexota bacterium]|nr:1-deoxy-D-xylulose-5-phosphate reductoisomerase [Chloroflexota bacterium]